MIYHYTSADTLALILKSSRIRFNRLDHVRDLSEAKTSQGIEFGKLFFVSCWTLESTESIPLWEISGGGFSGVRIGVPPYPFQLSDLHPPSTWNMTKQGEVLSPVPLDDMFADTHVVCPAILDRQKFSGDVRYVDDLQRAYDEAVHLATPRKGFLSLQIKEPFNLARMKSKFYKFESEHRFVLLILPGLPIPESGPGNKDYATKLPSHLIQCLRSGVGPDLDWFDVRLDMESVEQMEVTVGACVSDSDSAILLELQEEYGFRIRRSDLAGTIRCTQPRLP